MARPVSPLLSLDGMIGTTQLSEYMIHTAGTQQNPATHVPTGPHDSTPSTVSLRPLDSRRNPAIEVTALRPAAVCGQLWVSQDYGSLWEPAPGGKRKEAPAVKS